MVLGGNNGEVLLVPTCSITCAYVSLQAYVGTFSYCASFHVCTLIIFAAASTTVGKLTRFKKVVA